jgi:hypothetical protein
MALKPVSRETSNFFQRSRLFKEVGRELYGQPVPIQPPISKTLFPEEHSPFQQEVDLRGELLGETLLGELLVEILLLKNEYANCDKSSIA